MKKTIEKVRVWAENKGILNPDSRFKQVIKLTEEVGELCSALLKNDKEKTIDSVGDCLVVLTILSYQLGFSPQAALDHAYDQIKDRTGKTVDGVFIKNEPVHRAD